MSATSASDVQTSSSAGSRCKDTTNFADMQKKSHFGAIFLCRAYNVRCKVDMVSQFRS